MKIAVNKILPKILIPLNIIIIMLLLTLSIIMLYFSSSAQRVIFNHTALLYSYNDTQNNKPKNDVFLCVIDVSKGTVNVGNEIMYTFNSVNGETIKSIGIIESIVQNSAWIEGTDIVVNLNSNEYIGRVTVKNAVLGNIIWSITTSSPVIIYCCIGAGFIISCLVAVLLYISKSKQANLMGYIKSKKYLEDENEASSEEPYTDEIDPKSGLHIVYDVEDTPLEEAHGKDNGKDSNNPRPFENSQLSEEKPLFESIKSKGKVDKEKSSTEDKSKDDKRVEEETVTTRSPFQFIKRKKKAEVIATDKEVDEATSGLIDGIKTGLDINVDLKVNKKTDNEVSEEIAIIVPTEILDDNINEIQTSEDVVNNMNKVNNEEPEALISPAIDTEEPMKGKVSIDLMLDDIIQHAQQDFYDHYGDYTKEEK